MRLAPMNRPWEPMREIISAGDGLFPAELVSEFKKCRDQVTPEPFEAVRLTVEQDLGARLEDVFSHFDETPLAAAIGEGGGVHMVCSQPDAFDAALERVG